MTTEEVKLHKKATALNAIRKTYNPKSFYSENYESDAEIRDRIVRRIIENLEKELESLKTEKTNH